MIRTLFLTVAVSISLFNSLGAQEKAVETPLVPAGATWRYLDDGSNQDTAWRSTDFDDSKWKSGRAKLGYGDDDVVTQIGFGPDKNNKYTTTYFRHSFNVENPAQFNQLVVKVKADDGAVVYLNGKDVYRVNMPSGQITYLSGTCKGLGDEEEKVWGYNLFSDKKRPFGPIILVPGKNVIAVEVHQQYPSSSDAGFDLQLIGSTGAFDLPGAAPPKPPVGANPSSDPRVADLAAVAAKGSILPPFMREAPPVFVTPAVPMVSKNIHFFAFGDWSNFNKGRQQEVSAAIRAMHKKSPFQFGMTTGDNFYPKGIDSPLSPRWGHEYESQYGVMNIPIYVTLGNHDFYSPPSAAAEINYTHYSPSKTWKIPATHYTFTAGSSGVGSNPLAQFVVIETENFSDWQAAWLDSVLAASTAAWKIVVAHHDIYSNRTGGDSKQAAKIIPILKKHSIPVYLNGHYHTLQHHQVDGIDYITSGGGGANEMYPLYEKDSLKYNNRRKFAAAVAGFADIQITPEFFAFRFIDTGGSEIYAYRRHRTPAK